MGYTLASTLCEARQLVCTIAKFLFLGASNFSAVFFFLKTLQLTCHRPLSKRDLFIVQDYVLVDGKTEQWLYTYNHTLNHPYFAPRTGLVRMNFKYQGMVGVVEKRGTTRLTWLVNMDFGGMVPSSFTAGLSVGLMSLPIVKIEEVQDFVKTREGQEAAAAKPSDREGFSNEPKEISREAFALSQQKLIQAEKYAAELLIERNAFRARAKKAEEKVSELRRRLVRVGGVKEEEEEGQEEQQEESTVQEHIAAQRKEK